MTIKIPRRFIETEEFRILAEGFLREHGAWGQVPCPIEEITELKLGLGIDLIPGLMGVLGVDAFLSNDLRTITGDQFIFTHRMTRYHFSLAHEISHLILHSKTFSSYPVRTIDDYRAFRAQIDPDSYDQLETQANMLAGPILVPKPQLTERFRAARELAEREGLPIDDSGKTLEYVYSFLARQFEVSAEVIEHRISNEGLLEGLSVIQS